ncbi:sialate O-acetylesterase [Reichenbachiella sp. MALMAid0571]|uniref:sialate O-acetylesterase n=1 Tax=Reichenbachiella sp. MALMAid0571 TaxID=3143939 RepID=UPI0032DFABF1
MQLLKKLSLLSLLVFVTQVIYAQTSTPSFFSSNMVLQQDEEVAIWGNDDPKASVEVSGSWGETVLVKTNKEGKWKVKLKTPIAGGPYTVTIKGSKTITLENVLIGEVWICSGQSNMEMPLKGYKNQPINGSNEEILYSTNDRIRLFNTERTTSLKPEEDVPGKWLLSEPNSVGEFSATAYFFAKKLENILDVPIGLIETSWGGSTAEAWVDENTIEEFENLNVPNEIPEKGVNQSPTLLYNAMINPFVGYNIKGVIWYQGESNRNRSEEYKKLFPAMIGLWREKWQQEFPFYFVQIAPYGYNGGVNSAFIRESQLYAMQNVSNTGMAVTMDIGDCDYIHPREKKLVGERLVYWALAKTYNIGGVAYSGPVYKSSEKANDGRMVLTFDYAPNGLSSFGNELTGFQIAGEDKTFFPARARINGNKTITVWSDAVKNPVSVRYAFDNCTTGSLYNVEGLPASSFRTDNWDQ